MFFSTEKQILEPSKVNMLYQDAGWTAYTKDMERLISAINHSLDVISCWDNDRLVGLIRTVGDGHSILYIQDILVLKAYKRKGIGRKLFDSLLKLHPIERQIVLLSQDNPESRQFYESLGLTSYDQGGLVSFGLDRG